MLINDLRMHLAQDGEHGIFTGTFDPPHFGHTEAIRLGLQELPSISPIAVIPHSWNARKRPIDIKERIKWLIQTIQEFASDLESRIVVCNDRTIQDNPQGLDQLLNANRGRVLRIVGNDKPIQKVRGRNDALVMSTERLNDRNSTNIRRAIRSGEIDLVRQLVASSVLEDILANDYYK